LTVKHDRRNVVASCPVETLKLGLH